MHVPRVYRDSRHIRLAGLVLLFAGVVLPAIILLGSQSTVSAPNYTVRRIGRLSGSSGNLQNLVSERHADSQRRSVLGFSPTDGLSHIYFALQPLP